LLFILYLEPFQVRHHTIIYSLWKWNYKKQFLKAKSPTFRYPHYQ
jgi:hypothetical protein